MLYLSEQDVRAVGIDWDATIDVIEGAVRCLDAGDFAQPIKPYLRYRDLTNRIIAMPAFVGGPVNKAGIKWIASFPRNIDKGIARAHSILVLNDADTGAPVAIINTALLSVIRTASVTGLVLRKFDEVRPIRDAVVGMTGFGPIGREHLAMTAAVLGPRLKEVRIYDVRPIQHDFGALAGKVKVVGSWQEAYDEADVFMTCTVSSAPYIDRKPKAGSLQLNVSLRDYTTAVLEWMKPAIIVDDWEEVCREKTDIEIFHLETGLQKADTASINDVVCRAKIASYPAEQAVMFNPMGMAVFDIATAHHYVEQARKRGVGTELP